MLSYIVRRLLLMLPTLIGITLVVFFVMAMAPGGFGGAMLNQQGAQTAGKEAQQIRRYFMRRYGLDQPLVVQYGRWLNQISPLGFQTTSDVTYPPRQREAARRVLASGPSTDADARAWYELTMQLARYRTIRPARAAEQLLAVRRRPERVPDLLKTVGGKVDQAARERARRLQARVGEQPERARADLLSWLQLELMARQQVLLSRPTWKAPNLGKSLRGRSVWVLIREALPITLLLNILTIPIIYAVALLSGIYAARYRGRAFDVGSGVVLLGLWSVPVIWAGVMFIGYLANQQFVFWFPTAGLHALQAERMSFLPTRGGLGHTLGFALYVLLWPVGVCAALAGLAGAGMMLVRLGSGSRKRVGGGAAWMLGLGIAGAAVAAASIGLDWLPRQMAGFERGWLLDAAWHLVLPVVCLAYGGFAVLSKLTRASVLENLSTDYVRTARAKGVDDNSILFRHVMRNSILPLITVAAAILPALLAGSVVVENIFSLPGMGQLSVQAAFMQDRELVMGSTLIIGLIGLLSELIRDVCYAVADPRVSYE